jgi:hypothetical protein
MIYIDQIAELVAESIKAASLTPLRARESVPLSHCEAGRRENAIIEAQAVAHPRPLGRGARAGPDLNEYDAEQAGAKQAWD